jgi:hypothetical protein
MSFLSYSIFLLLTVGTALRRRFRYMEVWVGRTNGQERKRHAVISFRRYPFAGRLIFAFHRYHHHKVMFSKFLDRVSLAIYKSRTLLVVKRTGTGIFSPTMLVVSKSSWRTSKRIKSFTTKHIFELGKNDFEYSGRPLVSMWGVGYSTKTLNFSMNY